MFFSDTGNSCGNRTSFLQSLSIVHTLWNLSPIFRALLLVLLPSGCSSISIPDTPHLDLPQNPSFNSSDIRPEKTQLDILTFNDDRLRRLDSYQRLREFEGEIAYVESTGGQKIAFFCSNGPHRTYEWAHINSYSSLEKMRCYIEDESISEPTRTGECRITAGTDYGVAALWPVTSEIYLNSICCDFSDTPYSGKEITDVMIYLINVNGAVGLTEGSGNISEYIINHSRLDMEDIKRFKEPKIVYNPILQTIDKKILKPECRFLCMPALCCEGSLTTPPTRLVIEGKIDTVTYYWPINVGSTEDNRTYTIERSHRYVYDIQIRRKGTTDPDIPINIKAGEIKFKVEPWVEKEEYGIEY